MNKHFATTTATTATSTLLLVQPLFLSNKKNANFFKNPATKKSFLSIYRAASKSKLLLQKAKYPGKDIFTTFNNDEYQRAKIIDKITYGLITYNWKPLLIFIFLKLTYSFGGLYLSLFFFLLALIAFYWLINKERLGILILGLLLIIFSNNLTVSLSEMMLNRYLIYSYIAFIILLVILTDRVNVRKLKSSGARDVCSDDSLNEKPAHCCPPIVALRG